MRDYNFQARLTLTEELGYLTGCLRQAIEDLERGQADSALATLRRAPADAHLYAHRNDHLNDH